MLNFCDFKGILRPFGVRNLTQEESSSNHPSFGRTKTQAFAIRCQTVDEGVLMNFIAK